MISRRKWHELPLLWCGKFELGEKSISFSFLQVGSLIFGTLGVTLNWACLLRKALTYQKCNEPQLAHLLVQWKYIVSHSASLLFSWTNLWAKINFRVCNFSFSFVSSREKESAFVSAAVYRSKVISTSTELKRVSFKKTHVLEDPLSLHEVQIGDHFVHLLLWWISLRSH